jgi:hypothetical protein
MRNNLTHPKSIAMKSAKSFLPAPGIGLPLYLTTFFIAFAIVCTSCQKEVKTSATSITDADASIIAQENAAADAEYEDLDELAFSADADLQVSASSELGGAANGAGVGASLRVYENLSFKIGPCTKITVTPNDTTYPKTVVIDYGDGCICRDGKFRKGAIILNFTKPLRRPGAELTITLDNFYVNRAHIEGTKVIKNLTTGNVHQYSVVVTNGKVSWPNGRGFTYAKTKMVTQTAGMETITIRDDVYSITGRSATSYANGVNVVVNTESPLIKPVACHWIVSGVVKIKINDRTLFLDFGNGECDPKAWLKWNDQVIEITLP